MRLRKVVLGFPCSDNTSEFKFDLSLNYKLAGVIETYSEQKPTLVVSKIHLPCRRPIIVLPEKSQLYKTSFLRSLAFPIRYFWCNFFQIYIEYIKYIILGNHLFTPDFNPSFALFIEQTIKWANWVQTHSARLTVRVHLHNVRQKRPILIKWAKI